MDARFDAVVIGGGTKGWSVYPLKSSFEAIYPEEVRQMVIERWAEYGLP